MQTSEIFNLSSFDTYSINELISIIKQALQQEFVVDFQEGRQSDNSFIDLDNGRILRFFPNYRFTSIRDGICQTNESI